MGGPPIDRYITRVAALVAASLAVLALLTGQLWVAGAAAVAALLAALWPQGARIPDTSPEVPLQARLSAAERSSQNPAGMRSPEQTIEQGGPTPSMHADGPTAQSGDSSRTGWEGAPAGAAPAGAPVPPDASAPAGAAEARGRTSQSAATEPDAVIANLLGYARDALPVVCAHLWLQDQPTATLRLVTTAGEMCPAAVPEPFDEPWAAPTVSRGEATLTPMLALHEQDGATTLWRFAFPVATSEAIGAACLDILAEQAPARSVLENVALAHQHALAAALALHVARAATRRAGTLLEAARDLSRRLDADEVVGTALERAIDLSSAATGSVMLPAEDGITLRIVASHGLPEAVVSETSVTSGEGIAGWVFRTGKPLLVEDMQGRKGPRRRDVRSSVSVPISDEDGILGVLNVGSREYPARFTDADLAALETLGRQTASALRNARALASATDLYFSTLTALVVALETKDPYSRGGTGRIAEIAVALGTRAGLDEGQLQSLQIAALLHDIGMGIAAGPIGMTSRPLSTVERGLLKAHPVVAAQILADVPSLAEVVPIVYHHHEWFDGHGYVGGLAGEEIPMGSRLLAAADAFVAMTSQRPYRAAMGPEAALAEMAAKAGSQFDPEAVELLRDVLAEDPELAARASQY